MPDLIMTVDTAVTVPVNLLPLLDDTDFKTRETAVAYNATGMDLVWNFVTVAGVITQTAVTPTTGGDYDWTHVGDGMYKIEIPASGGASINNDAEGFGWFTGVATGVLPWRGPVIQFSPANIVNSLVTGTDKLDVNAAEYAGQATDSTDVALATAPTNFASLAIDANGRVKVQSNLAKNVQATVSFLMKDSTNHAPATGLTVSVSVSVDRGAFAAATNSVTEEGNGWYSITLTQSEMNGDEIMLHCTATGADDTEVQIRTDP